MIAVGEDELICDLAETYGIFNMRALPASTLAVLADGLSPESRIKSKINGREDVSMDTLLRAKMVDNLSLLVWMQTKDAMDGKNMPRSLVDILLKREPEEPKKELKGFSTAEEFQAAWKAGGGG